MTTEQIQDALESGDTDLILDGLADLRAERNTPPSAAVALACNRLMNHPDSDIRAEAIAAAGIHWAIPSSFALILETARDDENLDVRVVAARALIRYLEIHRDEVCATLAMIAMEESRSDLRAVAYIGLLEAEGRLTPHEKATVTEDIDSLDVDAELLRRWSVPIR